MELHQGDPTFEMNVLGAQGCSEERHSITGSRALEMTLSQTLFTETENGFMEPNHLMFGDCRISNPKGVKNFRGAVEVPSPVRHLQVSGLQAGHGNGVNVPLRVGWTKPLISLFWFK